MVTTEAPTAIPVRQLLIKMTLRTEKKKSLQELQMHLLGRRLSASSSLQDASEASKAVRDAAVFGASPVAKIGGEHQTMVADAAVKPSDFASLPEPDTRSIPVA